ncbi:ABC transporter substrate-binding protein [Shewanella cyperi]|uniref:ABC transporter substrate-binding protein n=1 Tax=Shewanella cyperi TaxID=2814292 RepID=UPI001A952734|nr:ABC transporter substrate-binding protein [Shewanella cyperi]QSX40582.1 ABC transporter substrate-binding protein [Shewanella cyperi]
MQKLWLFCCLVFMTPAWCAPDVVFFNPGRADESFWGDVDSLLQEAAAELQLQLLTEHAERNHFQMINQVQRLAAARELPRYVILVNEKSTGLSMLEALYGKPVYVQFVLNDISLGQRSELLKDPHWQRFLLPGLVPDNEAIGRQTATALLARAALSRPLALLISGDRLTPASVERTRGAEAVLQQGAAVTQTIYGLWQEERSYQQFKVLLVRYPALALVWTANDHMLFGALRAAQEAGKVPGKDIFFSSFNTSARVLALRRQGKLSVLAGGHLLTAAVALARLKRHRDTGIYPADLPQLFWLLEPDTPMFNALEQRDWQTLLALTLTMETPS